MSNITAGDTVCFKNLIRKSREYLVVRVNGDRASLLSYCSQHVTLTNIPVDLLVRRFSRMHRVINFIKSQYNNSSVGTVESYQAIMNGEDKWV